MLELALGAATVASGWSQYFKVALTSSPWHAHPPAWIFADGHNLVAALVVLAIAGVLCLGTRTSSAFTAVIVAIKLAIVLLVIFAGLSYIHSRNYHPFIPPSGSKPSPGGSSSQTLLQSLGAAPGTFGVGGIFSGAALVFFAFIGFDIVATNAEETRKPQRDVPIGIFASLAICTVLYIAVSLVVTGMVKYNRIDVKAPLSTAFNLGPPEHDRDDHRLRRAGRSHLGDPRTAHGPGPRVLRDEPRPAAAPGVLGHPVRVRARGDRVIFLRRLRPDLKRPFRTPLVPWLPILSVLASLWLMLNLQSATWVRFGIWMLVGPIVYFAYSYRHSQLSGARGTRGQSTGRGSERPDATAV